MKNLKKIIIMLLVVLIIIGICILSLTIKVLQGKAQMTEPDNTQDFIKELGLVDNYLTYFSVEKMLNNYIEYVASNNEEATYSLLDNTYIQKNSITKEDVLNKLSDIASYSSNALIREMYGQENAEDKVYYIYCMLGKENAGKDSYFTIYVDVSNLTYSIKPINQSEYNQEIKNTNKELEEKQITQNKYNREISVVPSERERVAKYFENFVENALYYPEYAYSLLTKESKEKNFPTLQDFKDYIDDKKDIFLSYTTKKTYDEFKNEDEYVLYLVRKENSGMEKFEIRMEEEYNKYTCIDYEGNNYTFYATSPLKYTVKLEND